MVGYFTNLLLLSECERHTVMPYTKPHSTDQLQSVIIHGTLSIHNNVCFTDIVESQFLNLITCQQGYVCLHYEYM